LDKMKLVLRAFDPDLLLFYLPTLRALEISDPAGFETFLLSQLETSDAIGMNEGRLEELRQMARDAWPVDWRPSDAVERRVAVWTAPLRPGETFFDSSVTADAAPPWPLVDMLDVEKGTGTPRFLDLNAAWAPRELQASLDWRVGRFMPEHLDGLAALGLGVESMEIPEAGLGDLLEFIWAGGNVGRVSWLPADAPFRTPFGHTLAGCGWYLPALGRQWDTRPLLVVAGDSPADAYLALAANRLLGASVWLPSSLRADDDLGRLVLRSLGGFIASVTGWGRSQRSMRPILTSTSISAEGLQAVREEIRGNSYPQIADWLGISGTPQVPVGDVTPA